MARAASARHPARRFRKRQVALPDGDLLVLLGDRTIEHTAPDGTVKRTWRTDDPDWSRHAIRFGIHEAPPTVKPSGRDASSERPPI